MPVDIAADVIGNVRLSEDYNVLTLAAPAIGEKTQPGQFVMVKAEMPCESLLRRPFSVFEVIREGGTATAISILNKRAGSNTRALYALETGDRVACLGPLGNAFVPQPPREAWMVAGGVGLAPFATLAESLAALGTPATLFYGARSARELFYLEFFEQLGVTLVLSTEDGSRGVPGRVTVPLEQALARQSADTVTIFACGPEPMLEAVSKLAVRYAQPSQVSVERVMGCGLGGCYSCVIPVYDTIAGPTSQAAGLKARATYGPVTDGEGSGPSHFVRSCIAGPVFAGAEIAWDRC